MGSARRRGIRTRDGQLGNREGRPNRICSIPSITPWGWEHLFPIHKDFLSTFAFGLSIEPGAALEHSFHYRIPYALIDASSPTGFAVYLPE